jgi:hypothetical protein
MWGVDVNKKILSLCKRIEHVTGRGVGVKPWREARKAAFALLAGETIGIAIGERVHMRRVKCQGFSRGSRQCFLIPIMSCHGRLFLFCLL